MKDVYLVHITLPDVFTNDLYNQIPKQKELINNLLERRIALNYSLDMERKNIWVFFEAKDREELNSILNTFPIIKDVKVTVHELAFYDAAPFPIQEPMMN